MSSINKINISRIFSVAPMMARTDKHFRNLIRIISNQTLLYTEMIPLGEVYKQKITAKIAHDVSEHPLAIQIGGVNNKQLKKAAAYAECLGFKEINLNCGCPSPRVTSGSFGACLLLKPYKVAEAVATLTSTVSLPITVKTRIGVDNFEDDQVLDSFINIVKSAGCKCFIIHARKAYLSGLSPKKNLTIPPLDYEKVQRIKKNHNDIKIILNGGISGICEAKKLLKMFDGVMLGRAVYNDPLILNEVDNILKKDETNSNKISINEVINRYIDYMHIQNSKGVPISKMVRHASNLISKVPGSKVWRRKIHECILSESLSPINNFRLLPKY